MNIMKKSALICFLVVPVLISWSQHPQGQMKSDKPLIWQAVTPKNPASDWSIRPHDRQNKDQDSASSNEACPVGEGKQIADLGQAAESGNLARVKQLVEECKTDPSGIIPSKGSNALHEAAYNGRTDVASYLIDSGVDPNARKKDGWAAVHLAVVGKDPLPILKLLSSKGADLQLKTLKDSQTAAEIIAAQPESEAYKFLTGPHDESSEHPAEDTGYVAAATTSWINIFHVMVLVVLSNVAGRLML